MRERREEGKRKEGSRREKEGGRKQGREAEKKRKKKACSWVSVISGGLWSLSHELGCLLLFLPWLYLQPSQGDSDNWSADN